MAKISILIALLPHLLCVMVQGQPSSCSEYFTYMTNPGIIDVIGQIKISPSSVNEEFHLKVALNTATELTSQVVRLELARSIQESVLAASFGRSLLYHIHYPTHEPPPSLSAIWFNNQQYCPDPQVSDNITATIELGHILYPPNEETFVSSYGPWQKISHQWHRNSSLYRIDNPSYDRLNKESEFDTKCGITSNYTDDTNRLIPNGEKTLPGQWPWLVAIYSQRTDNESLYDFKCAGSLLTTRHVITEMYCVVEWQQHYYSHKLEKRHRLHVSFGQFNSREWHGNHTGIVNREIMDIKIYHFAWSKGLAILILKTAVEYNAFIRPICLWSNSTNLQDIVNMTGYVVGWGIQWTRSDRWQYRYNTEEPRMVKVPLTELSERAPKGAFKELVITKSRWNDTPYDRGSGLVVFNIHTGRYELRGVAYSDNWDCNIEFADVANQISWIRQQISTNNAGSSLWSTKYVN